MNNAERRHNLVLTCLELTKLAEKSEVSAHEKYLSCDSPEWARGRGEAGDERRGVRPRCAQEHLPQCHPSPRIRRRAGSKPSARKPSDRSCCFSPKFQEHLLQFREQLRLNELLEIPRNCSVNFDENWEIICSARTTQRKPAKLA